MIACSRKDQCPELVLWRARSTAEGCRMLRVPRVASGKRAWREDYRGETNVTSKVANFRVREAHGICVWACRLPRRLVVRFSRELLSAFASQPGHFVKSCRRLALYRNFNRDICTFSVYLQHFVKSFEAPQMNTRSRHVRGEIISYSG